MAAVIKEEDGFWKEVLDVFFEDFVALFFPKAHAGIDWAAGFQFRDKELSKLHRDNETGTRFVDKLIEVKRQGSEQALVMVHIEVQSHPEDNFEERMWTYYYRTVDQRGGNVVSLALLADMAPRWRPNHYHRSLWGCELNFLFPTTKLLDFRAREEELSKSSNLFALLILAILKAQETAKETEKDMLKRARWKLQAVRSLYDRGVPQRKIRKLLKFVDWVVCLPEDLGDKLHMELAKTEEEKNMTYVTSFERFGIKKGLKQGLEQGRLISTRENILEVLEDRFGAVPDAVQDAVQGLSDIDICKKLLREAVRATSMEDFVAELNSIQEG